MPNNTDPPYDRLETILMGGTVDPPYSRKELIAMQAGGGSGGGGGEGSGGGVLIVNVTHASDEMALDKTAQEIYEAIQRHDRIIIQEDTTEESGYSANYYSLIGTYYSESGGSFLIWGFVDYDSDEIVMNPFFFESPSDYPVHTGMN